MLRGYCCLHNNFMNNNFINKRYLNSAVYTTTLWITAKTIVWTLTSSCILGWSDIEPFWKRALCCLQVYFYESNSKKSANFQKITGTLNMNFFFKVYIYCTFYFKAQTPKRKFVNKFLFKVFLRPQNGQIRFWPWWKEK